MATTKKTTTTKATTAKKTTTRKKAAIVAEEKSVFELMAEKFPIIETDVETPVGVVKVRNRIAFGEMITLINMIVDMCVNSETGEVEWEMCDYAIKMTICSTYCGIRVPKNIEVGYAGVCGKDGIYELIKDHIDPIQLNNIFDSINDKLNAREALNTSTATHKLGEFIESVHELMNMITDASDGYSQEEAINAIKHLSVLTGGKQ